MGDGSPRKTSPDKRQRVPSGLSSGSPRKKLALPSRVHQNPHNNKGKGDDVAAYHDTEPTTPGKGHPDDQDPTPRKPRRSQLGADQSSPSRLASRPNTHPIVLQKTVRARGSMPAPPQIELDDQVDQNGENEGYEDELDESSGTSTATREIDYSRIQAMDPSVHFDSLPGTTLSDTIFLDPRISGDMKVVMENICDLVDNPVGMIPHVIKEVRLSF